MNNNITERERKVIQLYENGYLQSKIAKEIRVSRKTVSKILKVNNVPKYTRTINCNWCDKEFTTEYRHQESCSDSCRHKYNRRNKGTEQTCIRCGNRFKGYRITDHCTAECHKEGQKESNDTKLLVTRMIRAIDPNRRGKCVECDKDIYLTRLNIMYCSEACSYRSNYTNRVYVPKEYNMKCRECGKHYTTNHKGSAGCSDRCKNRYNNRRNETNRRNKLRENGKIDWDISVERLSKRDKGLCYLCKSKTNLNDYTYDSNGYFIAGDYYPSVDHVLPVSKGGTHTWDNIKLAHRICNSLKSNNSISNKHKQLELMI